MRHVKRAIVSFAFAILIIGCGKATATSEPTPTSTRPLVPTFTPTSDQTEPGSAKIETTPTPTPLSVTIEVGPTRHQTEPGFVATPDTRNLVTVLVDSANVRNGPSTEFPVGGMVSKGGAYEVLGTNKTGTWYKIKLQTGSTWIFAKLTSKPTYPDRVSVVAEPSAPIKRVEPTKTSAPATVAPLPIFSPYRYRVVNKFCKPNCGITFVEGRVLDSSGNQKEGVRIKIWADGWEGLTVTTPTDIDKARSGGANYDFILQSNQPRDGTWYIAVVDENGNLLSEVVSFNTGSTDCQPDDTGCQWETIDFQEK